MKLARSSALGVLGLLGVLGAGGLAAAQEGLIVDPWAHAVSALFPTDRAPAPVERAVGVASFPIEHPSTAPAVVPVGPPLRQGAADPKAPLAIGPTAPLDAAEAPWVEPSPAAVPTAHRATPTQWAWRIREIIDPWAKGPVAVAVTDPSIIDPWAVGPRGRY